jgi:hypothetical protein
MDIPGTSAGAIDAVGGTHHLVKLPTSSIAVFPLSIIVCERAVTIGKRLFNTIKET